MSAPKEAASGGIGLTGLLFLVLLTLKLTGHFEHSWWLVTAPLWGGLALALAIIAIALIGAGVLYGAAAILEAFSARRRP